MNKTLGCICRAHFGVVKKRLQKPLRMNRFSPAGACYTRCSQLALAISKDERLTSPQLVLGRDVADGAVQPLRIVDRYEFPHNALRILQ